MVDAVRLPYWIQHADFTTDDYDPVDAAAGVRAFTEHDWTEEMSVYSALEISGNQHCPPGIGFVHPHGSILHVCPDANGRAMVHYHMMIVRKLLMISLSGRVVLTKPDLQRQQVVELIRLFFQELDDEIRARLVA